MLKIIADQMTKFWIFLRNTCSSWNFSAQVCFDRFLTLVLFCFFLVSLFNKKSFTLYDSRRYGHPPLNCWPLIPTMKKTKSINLLLTIKENKIRLLSAFFTHYYEELLWIAEADGIIFFNVWSESVIWTSFIWHLVRFNEAS